MHPPDQPVYNKDEAERVRDTGLLFLQRGNVEKAVWCFNKSKKLYTLEGIDDLIQKATVLLSQPQQTKEQNIHAPQPTPAVPPQQPELPKDYTEDHLMIVNRIIGFVDFYDKLSLQSTATEDEIKKQYRLVFPPSYLSLLLLV